MTTRMTQSEAAKQKAMNEPAPHIHELSFNNSGRAFQHPPNFDDGPIYLNAKEVNSKAYKKILAADPPENHVKSRVAIPLTEKEMHTDSLPGLHKYLLVGWIPQNISDFPKVTKLKGGSIIGNKRPAEDEVILYDPKDTESLPLMAVVEVTDEDTHQDNASVSTFVLLHQQEDAGVCTPYVASADDVFYLSLFRDNSTSKHNRKGAWNRIVRKYAVAQSISTKPLTAKSLAHRRARDQSKLVLPPTISLRNEIGALVAAYTMSKESWCLDELKAVLETIDRDLTMAPPKNSALHAFADLGTEQRERYTEVDATGFVNEMRVAWPDVTLQVWHVCMLGQAVQLAQVAIDYEHLQPFLREGLYRIEQAFASGDLHKDVLRTTPDDEEQLKQLTQIAQNTNETVRRVLSFANIPVNTSVKDEGHLLSAIKTKLVEVVKTDNEFTKMLQQAAGDQALGVNYQDIWGKYCEQSDTDGARAAFMDVVKFANLAFRQKESHLARIVEGIVDILEQAGI